MKLTVTVEDARHEVTFDEAYLKRTLTLNGVALDVSLLEIDGCRVRFTVDNRPVDALVTGTLPDLVVDVGWGQRSMRVEESRLAEVRRISGLTHRLHAASDLKAPMPGLITRILVAEGDTVTSGTPMLVMEAMKMENELRAPGPGKVKRIKVRSGEAVEVGTVLVTFDTSAVEEPAT
jgi:biotin carboxyl carrier protein